VIRPYSHSLSDDERLYRPDAERQADAARDPVPACRLFLLREGILDENGINKIEKEIEEQIQADADRALDAALPQPETIYNFVYSPDLDPTSAAFETQSALPLPSPADGKPPADSQNKTSQNKASQNKTMADLINTTLRDEMRATSASSNLRRRRRRLQPRRVSQAQAGQRQRRSLQTNRRPAGRVRLRPRLQLAAGRGQHRRPRRGHGHARAEAGG
jgi:hypothetical protein